MKDSENLNRVIYGDHEQATVRGKLIQQFPFLTVELQFSQGKKEVTETKLIGKYNLENILAAAAIGYHFKVPENKIGNAITAYQPTNNRSQLIKKGSNTYILDAYNANPSSMALALENFAEWNVPDKVLILGDMAELGEHSLNEHKAILKLAADLGFGEVILVGPNFEQAETQKKDSSWRFPTVESLKEWLATEPYKNATFLLKGSRVNKLEKLLED